MPAAVGRAGPRRRCAHGRAAGSGSDPASLGDLYDDAAAISAALEAIGGARVVVGHSYGGSSVSQAADLRVTCAGSSNLCVLMQDVGDALLTVVDGAYPPDSVPGTDILLRGRYRHPAAPSGTHGEARPAGAPHALLPRSVPRPPGRGRPVC
ncbi:alpha/beta fold hydrolase [Streptomyces sp. NRRL WC-3744]|uniref:alpha/beta fold hydrolase n=1 Tax=Streptomyces sp. NRRL WC-3744 TaxID=1463935 RepID=UPI003B635614